MVIFMNLKDIVFVHRGKYSLNSFENSLEAFKFCVDNNLNIEIDLHILKDKSVIVFHDNNLKRLFNKDFNVKNLSYQSMSDECNVHVPTLQDVLSLVNGKVVLDIELKYDVLNGDLEKAVIEILENYKGKFILKSFHPLIVWRLKRLVSKRKLNFKVGLLVENWFLLLFSYVFIHPNFYAINYKCMDKSFFRFVSKRKDTLLYTIKSKDVYDFFKCKGYGLVIEDYSIMM